MGKGWLDGEKYESRGIPQNQHGAFSQDAYLVERRRLDKDKDEA